jgi:hypothetical protein
VWLLSYLSSHEYGSTSTNVRPYRGQWPDSRLVSGNGGERAALDSKERNNPAREGMNEQTRAYWRLANGGRAANRLLFGVLLVYAIVRGSFSGVDLHRGSVRAQASDLLGFAALTGLLAYATVELVKRMTSLRSSVNFAVVQMWVEERLRVGRRNLEHEQEIWQRRVRERRVRDRAFAPLPPANPPVDLFEYNLMGLLVSALGTRALAETFDLPPERLVAQISTSIDVALFEPSRYASLLWAVAGITPRPPDLPANQDTELIGSREAQVLRLSLDDLQTMLTQRWRGIVQGSAVWIAGLYGVLASFAGGLSGANQARYLLAALVLGGPIAWAVRDVTAVLTRLRR